MQSIGIVICYFGQWPPWFTIFLETCRHNPTVHFLFFTDCELPERAPKNTRFTPLSLDAFSTLASDKLDLPIQVKTPYKICDFLPAYGVIFEDHLETFDFWGHGDLDVVYGDLRHFLTDDVLANHDVITTRKEYIAGHLTLFRNTGMARRLYAYSADYQTAFEQESYVSFDECHFLWYYLLAGGDLRIVTSAIDSMTHIVDRLAEEGVIRASFAPLVREVVDLQGTSLAWKVCWQQGRLYDIRRREEIMYLHFHMVKKNETFVVPTWKTIPGIFCVSEYGFSVGRRLRALTEAQTR